MRPVRRCPLRAAADLHSQPDQSRRPSASRAYARPASIARNCVTAPSRAFKCAGEAEVRLGGVEYMYRSIWAPLACAAAVTVAAATIDCRALAQATDAKPVPLPKVTVEQSETPVPTKPAKKKTMGKAKQPAAIATAPPSSAVAGQTSGAGAIPNGVPASRAGSLTSPNTAEARAEIDRTPGAVELVPDTAYKTSTPSATIKDALDYVPGVFAQPKWGDDTRLSIRGPGSRATSICAGCSSTWTASRSTPPTASATSRRSIRPPTATSRSTKVPMPCASAPTRSAAPSIS